MPKQQDMQLINPSGTVVTLSHDVTTYNADRHVLSFGVEQDLRDAGYRELEDGESVPPQYWESAEGALVMSDYAGRALPAAPAVDDAE